MKISTIAVFSVACAAVLSACGGGGGSGGESHAPYQITLRAERTQLPINVGNVGPGIGVSAPYTTTVYVQATDGGNPIPGGDDGVFGCNTSYGLSSGPLYYLDGKDEHMHDVTLPDGSTVKVPSAYRSITLGSNAGGASFHFHAGDQAGTATITCSVFDPRDKKNVATSISITVGAATGKPASIVNTMQAPGYLGTQPNVHNLPASVVVNTRVWDDANQPVPDPAAANLQVRIRPFGASAGASLSAGGQSGSTVQIRTLNGQGQFSVASGPNKGVILLELIADRADNNVANGIQDPIIQFTTVTVHQAVAATPLTIKDTELSVTNGMPYSYALTAEGGVPPYQWAGSGLPAGLSLSADGVLSGMPTAPSGTYNAILTVTDETGDPVSQNIVIKVEGDLAIDGCTADTSAPCALPPGKVGTAYGYTLSFSIGDPTVPVTWAVTGVLPPGLTVGADGIISGNPTTAGNYVFVVTATRGSLVVKRQVSITVSS